jgi:hypothetical protein
MECPDTFMLIQCNSDRLQWSLFLPRLTQLNAAKETSSQTLDWTTIENSSDTNRTMLEASKLFRNWTESVVTNGSGCESLDIPRYRYLVYVCDQSIDSLVNPARVNEATGSFLVLVNAEEYIKSCSETEESWREDLDEGESDVEDAFANWPDTTWKLIAAEDIKETMHTLRTDPDPWFQCPWGLSRSSLRVSPFLLRIGHS